MSDETLSHHPQKLYVAFLYGQNISGRTYLTAEHVQALVRPLAPRITFVKAVSRTNNILLLCESSVTEQSILEALSISFVSNCVVIEVGVLRRILQAAQKGLRSIKQSAEPPYQLNIDGVEWDWCLVLCSDELPACISDEPSPFPPTTRVVPVCILDSRALLVRKRRKNRIETKMMSGEILIKPWARALRRKGIVTTSLTSRTLNQIDRIVAIAEERNVIDHNDYTQNPCR